MDFKEAFKSEEFADVQLVLLCRAAPSQAEDPLNASASAKNDPQACVGGVESRSGVAELHVINSFPAHRVFLCKSDYFRAQVHRWQPDGCTDAAGSRKRDRSGRDGMPELHLTLDSADQQAAAEAVIATLYLASQPLLGLMMEQLVQAVILSDRLQLSGAAQQAVAALERKLSSVQQIPQALTDMFSNLPAWPSCMLPLIPVIAKAWPKHRAHDSGLGQTEPLQRILLAVFGRLHEVWADQQLRELLMKLPLSAMQLLLSAHQLVVDSEDTVLYTAVQYVAASAPAERSSARQKLAGVIRCPWLSTCRLAAAALAEDPDDPDHGDDDYDGEQQHMLQHLKVQLRRLLSLRLGGPSRMLKRVQENTSSPPAGWLLPSRPHQDIPTVSVTWRVTVEDLQRVCKRCCESQVQQKLQSPTSPPKAGFAWCL